MLSTIAACGTIKKEISPRSDSRAFFLFLRNLGDILLSVNIRLTMCRLPHKQIRSVDSHPLTGDFNQALSG